MIETGSPALSAYQNERLKRFIKQNEKEPRESIVFVGDSITEFFPLRKYFGQDLPLVNRGISGTDTVWLEEHLTNQVITLAPKQVFLMIGVNDIGRGYPVRDIAERLAAIVAKLRQELFFTDIMLLSLLPVNESAAYQATVKVRTNATIQALNRDLQVLPGVDFIDLYPLLLDASGNLAETYTTDGLHLNQKAYETLATFLKVFVKN